MTRGTLLSRYRALLKPLPIEGLPDLLLFRPIAYPIVQVLKKFPVTPDQVSYSAISTGLLSGFCFALGTRLSFALAGLFYALTASLDCADGMLARLKRSGTPLGRVIDGAVDYTNSVAILTGLAIGVARAGFYPLFEAWAVTAVAGISLGVHCIVVDHYRCQYAFQVWGSRSSVFDEIRLQEESLKALRAEGGHRLLRFVLTASLGYHRLQARIAPPGRRFDARTYARLNVVALRAWQMIELSAHIVVLIVAALLFKPRIFYFYTIVVANLWLLVLAPIQYVLNRRVAALSAAMDPPTDGQALSDGIS